jgi:mRNA interferase MazF
MKMKARFMICEVGDVVVVPFPFTDRTTSKRRPALVLSRKAFNSSGHTVFAMITSTRKTRWPGDVAIPAGEAGLTADSCVRLKLFTIENTFILRMLGSLGPVLRSAVEQSLRQELL